MIRLHNQVFTERVSFDTPTLLIGCHFRNGVDLVSEGSIWTGNRFDGDCTVDGEPMGEWVTKYALAWNAALTMEGDG